MEFSHTCTHPAHKLEFVKLPLAPLNENYRTTKFAHSENPGLKQYGIFAVGQFDFRRGQISVHAVLIAKINNRLIIVRSTLIERRQQEWVRHFQLSDRVAT